MSAAIPRCETCGGECAFERIFGPAPPESQESYGIAWGCPACGKRTLDVCNLGPLAPTAASCLNCGQERISGEVCPGCGLTPAQEAAFLHVPIPAGQDPIRAARGAFERGLFQHGIAVLNQALQTDSSLIRAWTLKYNFYRRLGFYRQSQEMFRQAIQRSPSAALWFFYGDSLAGGGSDAQAVDAFRRALEYPEEDPKGRAITWSELGNALTRLQDYPAAAEAHQRAIATLPSFAALYLNYSDTLIRQRRWDDVLETVETGLEHATADADRAALFEPKAHALASLMRGDESLIAIQKAMSLGAKSFRAHYLHGRALALVGRLEDARAAMQRVLELNPGHPDAQQAIQMIDDALRG